MTSHFAGVRCTRLILRPLRFQNKNNMPVDWNVRRTRGRSLFLLGCVALVVMGAGSSYLGYQDGEPLTAAWSRMSVGVGAAAIGLLGLVLMAVGSARRERLLFTTAAMRARRVRVSGWAASLVIGACVCFYFYASVGA